MLAEIKMIKTVTISKTLAKNMSKIVAKSNLIKTVSKSSKQLKLLKQ